MHLGPGIHVSRSGAFFTQTNLVSHLLSQEQRGLIRYRVAHRKLRVGGQLERLPPDIRTTRAVHEPHSDAYPVAEILHRSVDDVGGVEKPRDRISRGRPSAERRDAVPRHDI